MMISSSSHDLVSSHLNEFETGNPEAVVLHLMQN